jgi:hypothetical protein
MSAITGVAPLLRYRTATVSLSLLLVLILTFVWAPSVLTEGTIEEVDHVSVPNPLGVVSFRLQNQTFVAVITNFAPDQPGQVENVQGREGWKSLVRGQRRCRD